MWKGYLSVPCYVCVGVRGEELNSRNNAPNIPSSLKFSTLYCVKG